MKTPSASGTDFTQGHGHDFFEWLTHDKGYARRLTNFGKIVNTAGHPQPWANSPTDRDPLKRGMPERTGAQGHGRELDEDPRRSLGRVVNTSGAYCAHR